MQKGVWVALEMNLSGCYPLNVSLCPKIIAEYGLNVKLLINFAPLVYIWYLQESEWLW